MDWLLILLVLLAIAVNIRSFMALNQFQKQRRIMLEDAEAMNASMEEFVENIEKENDELYNRLVEHIAQKESGLEQRLHRLEQRSGSGQAGVHAESAPPVKNAKTAKPKTPAKPAEPVPDPELPEHEKIEQLHKQGFSPVQIAKVVKAERGEIELIINMFKKKQSYQK
ncbi:DUF6115 domain-containing protein [Planococcus sp. CAU13]|uniref:DUF6115 domain-containing protein n=1 Tax=Planococcus sp. CAU13 TaxID=1541197 RepID=UPI00052FEA64|nr:hypothetical protein [Planococcus sp. CAU13]